MPLISEEEQHLIYSTYPGHEIAPVPEFKLYVSGMLKEQAEKDYPGVEVVVVDHIPEHLMKPDPKKEASNMRFSGLMAAAMSFIGAGIERTPPRSYPSKKSSYVSPKRAKVLRKRAIDKANRKRK